MKVRLLAIVFGFGLVVGLPLAAGAGPTSSADDDSDTIDNIFDNCIDDVNLEQIDSNHDGCGDVCTPKADINNNGVIETGDFFTWRAEFKASCTGEACLADVNNNGVVETGDFFTWRAEFKASAIYGESGLPEEQISGFCQAATP